MPLIVNFKRKDAQSLRCPELGCVGTFLLGHGCQTSANIRIQHHESQLQIISFVCFPLTLMLLVNSHKVFNLILNEVVLRVDTLVLCTFLLVLNVFNPQHSRLLH